MQTMIRVDEETKNKLLLLKIKKGMKNMSDVVDELIKFAELEDVKNKTLINNDITLEV